jgi:hypothetical protein
MSKILSTLLFAASAFSVFAERKESLPAFYLESSSVAPELGKHAEFVIRFKGLPYSQDPTHLVWSIDKKSSARVKLDADMTLTVRTTPGVHSFQFFYSKEYEEIQTGKVEIKAGHRDTYIAQFSETNVIYTIEKPVLYIYPERTMEVSLNVLPKGKMRFTYPELKDEWQMTAHPDGELEIEGRSYPYLFWESENPVVHTNWEEGAVIARNEVVSFLESQLDFIGLNAQERTDFITYWAPRMMRHPHCAVHFLQNSACGQFADLIVLPQPDAINRVYILWAPIDNFEDNTYLRPQKLQKINRLGFDILEWGGVQLNTYPKNTEE